MRSAFNKARRSHLKGAPRGAARGSTLPKNTPPGKTEHPVAPRRLLVDRVQLLEQLVAGLTGQDAQNRPEPAPPLPTPGSDRETGRTTPPEAGEARPRGGLHERFDRLVDQLREFSRVVRTEVRTDIHDLRGLSYENTDGVLKSLAHLETRQNEHDLAVRTALTNHQAGLEALNKTLAALLEGLRWSLNDMVTGFNRVTKTLREDLVPDVQALLDRVPERA